jgi:hypothetical protein
MTPTLFLLIFALSLIHALGMLKIPACRDQSTVGMGSDSKVSGGIDIEPIRSVPIFLNEVGRGSNALYRRNDLSLGADKLSISVAGASACSGPVRKSWSSVA